MRHLLTAATALALGSGSAHAWDPAGHMLVGEIAWLSSSPAVRAKVDAITKKLDTTYSGGRPYNFTTANCWLDDMRPKPGNPWSRWHYVDLPKTMDSASFALPEPPHVVWAIQESLKQLGDAQLPEDKRPEALAVLIHCIGDLHQPLHATTWDDRGGNGYLVAGVTFNDLYKGGRGNLHAFWDEAYRVVAREGRIVETFVTPAVAARPEPGQMGVISSAAKEIMKTNPAQSLAAEIAVLDPEAWAKESHEIGITVGYPDGPHPGNNEVRTLPPAFGTASQKVAAKRVALAGYRMAKVLDSLFGK